MAAIPWFLGSVSAIGRANKPAGPLIGFGGIGIRACLIGGK